MTRRKCRHPKWARLVDRSRETCSLCEAWRECRDGWVVEWVEPEEPTTAANETSVDEAALR